VNNGNVWGLRLLAIGLAMTLWFIVSGDKREPESGKIVDAPVTYNVPSGFIILDPIDKVRVRLRGTTTHIRNVNSFEVAAIVDITSAQVGSLQVSLGADNIVGPDNVEVVSVEPALLSLNIDRLATGMLPVAATLVGEPAAGAIVQGAAVVPGQVLVRGPQSRLRQTTALQTSPVDLTGHALDFEEQAAVVSPDPLITVVQPAIVTVRIPLSIPGAGSGDSLLTDSTQD